MSGVGLAPVFAPLLRGAATIFMLHRFADPERGSAGHDPNLLRRHLAALRKEGRELIGVAELVRRCEEKDRIGRAIAFTVDDGYADFASVAAPIFAEFDCPVTVFLVTGAIDGQGWYWWDLVAAALELSDRREADIAIAGEVLQLRWPDRAGRIRAEAELISALKRATEADRREALSAIPRVFDVSLPPRPPHRFAPMTWSEVRACAERGATFGPHSVTHPILSRIGDEQALQEIDGSWQRMRAETDAAIKVFAYPNGKPADYSDRDVAMLRRLGFSAAMTAAPGYLTAGAWSAANGAFQIPRFAYPDTHEELVQITSGVERLRPAAHRAKAAAAWLTAWWPEIG